MQEDFQITIVVIVGTLILMSLVFFVILSVIMYQKAQGRHLQIYNELKNQYQKEILEVNLEVRESTLDKVSEEIHDNVGQVLSLVKLNLHSINNVENNEQLSGSISLLNKAISGLRNVAHIISSNNLDTSLEQLLTKEVDQLTTIGKIKAILSISDNFEEEIGSEKTLIIYRMVQEIINNSIKHSEAKNVSISLKKEGDQISLLLIDDGIGFNVENVLTTSNGLQNLQRRAKVINAGFDIESEISKGTAIKITFNNSPVYED